MKFCHCDQIQFVKMIRTKKFVFDIVYLISNCICGENYFALVQYSVHLSSLVLSNEPGS